MFTSIGVEKRLTKWRSLLLGEVYKHRTRRHIRMQRRFCKKFCKCLLTNKHSGNARTEIMSRITRALRYERQVHYGVAVRGKKKIRIELYHSTISLSCYF